MASQVSKTQIDRLGDRLRRGKIAEDHLVLLDEYRRSFGEAYDLVVAAIQNELGLEPTGRPAKSTTSISEKLFRESIRLTQVQDIAGCRLLVQEIAEQERVVEALVRVFTNAAVVDRREQPSHVIVRIADKLVEIQVRTLLQHLWAEQSEKLSDVVDPAIKYGKGNEAIVKELLTASGLIAQQEAQEVRLADLERRVSVMLSRPSLAPDTEETLTNLRRDINEAKTRQVTSREQTVKILQRTIDRVSTIGGRNVIPN